MRIERRHGFETGRFGRALKDARGTRIPVIVLTGFLGAGKTTILNNFLSDPAGARSFVIVNEFGDTPVDHHLMRESADAITLLGNGCACCTVRTDLEAALRLLATQKLRGEIEAFDRILVETSGAADPLPVLRTFLSDRSLADTFHIQSVITVVDAMHGLATLARHPESVSQVALADCLVLSKTDLVGPGKLADLRKLLLNLNPQAELSTARAGHVDPALLAAPPAPRQSDRIKMLAVETPSHAQPFISFTLRFDKALPWMPLSHAITTLTRLRGDDILRMKGFVAIEGCPGPVVLHAVQHVAHPPLELKDWPDEDRTGRLVFITHGLLEAQVRAVFESIIALDKKYD